MDIPMTIFVGTKLILSTPMTRIAYNEYRGWKLPEDEEHLRNEAGMLVEYEDVGHPNMEGHAGYVSWSPLQVFKDAYQSSGSMTFGSALELLKRGHKVSRSGWNGKGMFISLSETSDVVLKAENFWSPHNKQFAEDNGGSAIVAPCITMKTAQGKIVMGWLASQEDMLSSDWGFSE